MIKICQKQNEQSAVFVGETGAGKSSSINSVARESYFEVSHGIEPNQVDIKKKTF